MTLRDTLVVRHAGDLDALASAVVDACVATVARHAEAARIAGHGGTHWALLSAAIDTRVCLDAPPREVRREPPESATALVTARVIYTAIRAHPEQHAANQALIQVALEDAQRDVDRLTQLLRILT
jgi:hypothetical protein